MDIELSDLDHAAGRNSLSHFHQLLADAERLFNFVTHCLIKH